MNFYNGLTDFFKILFSKEFWQAEITSYEAGLFVGASFLIFLISIIISIF